MTSTDSTAKAKGSAEVVGVGGDSDRWRKILLNHFGDGSAAKEEGLPLDSSGSQSKFDPKPVSFRPSLTSLAAHDAQYEAAELAFQHLLQKDLPLWLAFTISHQFVRQTDDTLVPKGTKFEPDIYRPLSGTVWSQSVLDSLAEYCQKMARGDRVIPGRPPKWDQYPYSFCAIKNTRRKMEDRHVVLPSLAAIAAPDFYDNNVDKMGELQEDGYFAVFDGHGGSECAHYAVSQLPSLLITDKDYFSNTEMAIRHSMAEFGDRLDAKCKHEKLSSGTTAVCALLKRRKLYVSWVGDSGAAILNSEKIIMLTRNHSPTDPDEYKRIEEAGGALMTVQGELRVNGILNITRAFGDIGCKPVIISDPEVSSLDLAQGDYLLLVACDGLWDTLDEADVFRAVSDFVVQNEPRQYYSLANFVVERAKDAGAMDNITLIVIFLRPITDLWSLFCDDKEKPAE